ncbi:MAG: DegV family protein [Defluviitaleaceae bacterium]|nr:DegV family protein [Defluviitaleaceae bacterium]
MFQIISDSGCDLNAQETTKYNVKIVPFYINFDHEVPLREGVDINNEDYFKRLTSEKGVFPKTSQPSPQDYIDTYKPYLEAGKDIIILTISSKLSGSHNSASLAANILKDEFPTRKIMIIDSLSVSVGQGLILREIIKMRDAGFSIDRTVSTAEKVVKSTRIYFTLDTIEYLKKGGRVGTVTALVGGILGLRPILQLEEGAVSQLDSVRGKKRAMKLIEDAMVDALKDEIKNINIGIGHVLSKDDATSFQVNTETALGIKIANPLTEIGAAIGTHAGPGALGFAYCKKYQCFTTFTKKSEAVA